MQGKAGLKQSSDARVVIGRTPLYLLLLVLVVVSTAVGAVTLGVLYRAGFAEEQARLVEVAQSQARLIEAIARFDRHSRNTPNGTALDATLVQVREAHANFAGFGKSGEFMMAQRAGDQVVFLLNHRHRDMQTPDPVPFDGDLAEPMQRALRGESGTVVALDYAGVQVLAAHEPVAEYGLGIVAKIDLEEVQAPFIRAGLLALEVSVVLILVGVWFFHAVVGGMLRRLEKSEAQLAEAQKIGHVGSWERDLARRELVWSDEVYRLFGMNPDGQPATFKRFLQAVHPDDREAVAQAMGDGMENGTDFSIDYRVVLPDGAIRWMHEEAHELRTDGGKRARRVGTVQDVTRRKQFEMELQQRNDALQDALATIKTISGVVPLCAWCSKKVKDDDGNWVRLEAYFEGHTDAQVSHGMCPDCQARFRNGRH